MQSCGVQVGAPRSHPAKSCFWSDCNHRARRRQHIMAISFAAAQEELELLSTFPSAGTAQLNENEVGG